MTKGSTTTGPPSTTTWSRSFLCCFGCSSEKTPLTDEVNSSRRSRSRSWTSKWRLYSFSFKKPPKKTAPVDPTTDHRKPKSENDAPTKIPVTEENATSVKNHGITVTSGEQNTRRKNRNGRKETKTAGKSTTAGRGGASPEQKTVTIAHPCVSSPLKPLTHAKTRPVAKSLKQHASPAGGGGGKEAYRKTPPAGGDFDSIIGMSIVLVILLIMVLWGKLCAILCTSAWLFIAPRLVAAGKSSAVETTEELPPKLYNNEDLESVEYKKQVVLEGLLQRSHRKVVGRL